MRTRREGTAQGLVAAVFINLLAAASVSAQICPGDCDADQVVTTEEATTAVEIAIDSRPLADCTAANVLEDARITVDEIVRAVVSHLGRCPGSASPSPTPTGTPTPTPTVTAAGGDQLPPTNAADLLAWLSGGTYLSWHAESAVHQSVGPHFGRVRTFLNDAVFEALAAGSASHPAGAALVKELYGSSGTQVRGWSVMVKTQESSAGGTGWYWLERFGSTTYASGNNSPGCYGCHGTNYGGLTTRDYVLTPFPLQ